MVTRIIIFLLAFLSVNLFAASVDIKVSSNHSSGEPINVTFQVEGSDNVEIVKHPGAAGDWQVGGIQQFRSSEIDFQGNSKSSISIVFQFLPLKKGRLRLPVAQVSVDGKTYTSPESVITSTQPQPNSQAQRPSVPVPLFPFGDDDDFFGNPFGNVRPQNDKNLEVMIVAEPSKTEAYVGELVTLPFFVNTNQDIFRTLEFAGFPTFKDFLKEELLLPKNFIPKRVTYRGSNYLKVEVIRFALFPLKPGDLIIDPLKMRFEIDNGVFAFRNFFQNKNSEPQSFVKNSGSIPIKVIPLPPKPANITQEDIPVGQYKIKLEPPKESLVQNEPFSLKIHVEGRGNIKGISEPKLNLPASLQKSKTTPFYEVNTDSVGYKDFDLLLVPKAAGELKIAENSWTYFDPDKKRYETIPLAPIQLNIEGSTKQSAIANADSTDEIVYKGNQEFTSVNSPSIPLVFWILPIVMYAAAAFFFVQRRRRENEDTLLKNKPWIHIENSLRALHDPYSLESLRLIEEWLLVRFRSLSMDEAAFDDLIQKLLRICPATVHKKVNQLREKFREIEALRFGVVGSETRFTSSFEEIKRLTEDIIHSSESVSAADDADDD